MFDLVLRGGRVYDGTGAPPVDADVGVVDGRIAEIGPGLGRARRILDVEGLAVSPGFIDNHTHFDAQLLWDPAATTSCFHGITTVVIGNCGLSLAPCRDDTRDALIGTLGRVEAISRRVLEAGIDWSWHTTAEYFARLRGRIGVNVGALIGHCAVRHAVMGEDAVERAATDHEIHAMQALVRDGMAAGALGFSTNNTPRHMREDGKPIASRFADGREVDALFAVLAELGAGVLQNVQGWSPSMDIKAKVDYVADVALKTGRPVLWQGIVHRWHEGDDWRTALAATARVREDDRVRMYPVTQVKPVEKRFTLQNAQVFDEFPTWRTVMMTPLERRTALFADAEIRRKLSWEAIEDPARSHFGKRWDLVWINDVVHEEHRELVGLSIAELAARRGASVIDAFLDLALAENLGTEFFRYSTQGDPAAVAEILRSPHVLVGQSDAGAHLVFDAAFGFSSTFLGRWVRDERLMTLEAGIRRLTLDVADVFGMRDRGALAPGYAADVAVFDPDRIDSFDPEWATDLPGGERRLVQRAAGVAHTIVNGVPLVEDGELTGALSGQVVGAWI